jgi:hypothetical protein
VGNGMERATPWNCRNASALHHYFKGIHLFKPYKQQLVTQDDPQELFAIHYRRSIPGYSSLNKTKNPLQELILQIRIF